MRILFECGHYLTCGYYSRKYGIWKECVIYDELTVNERQEDKQFLSMLECVRCGCPTDETVPLTRVIQVSVADRFTELQKSRQSPVCLFPTRKACANQNNEMLARLSSKVHDHTCTDELDQTVSTCKWTKKAIEHLE